MATEISEKLTQAEIEEGISTILRYPYPRRPQIGDLIPEQLLIKFLLYGTEIMRREPMLVEFEFSDKCSVVGDLHGNINDLIGVIYESGLPPRSYYVFLGTYGWFRKDSSVNEIKQTFEKDLGIRRTEDVVFFSRSVADNSIIHYSYAPNHLAIGDYVGRGECQLDVFVTVLLLKLRWPNYICMLRGNHECQDQSEDDGFEQTCLEAYQSFDVFKLLIQLFNYMPVSAIVNDQVLCCHGGISQWMISRDAIRSIPRPTNIKKMKLLENCLLTDILWSDPEAEQDVPFLPSQRGISYTFNEDALNDVFYYLQCSVLIRGHKWVDSGICEEIKGKCYTVHTTSMSDDALVPAFIILRTDRFSSTLHHSFVRVDISKNAIHPFSADYSDPVWTELLRNFILRSFTKDSLTYLEDMDYQSILTHMNPRIPQLRQHISHLQMARWTLTFAPEIFNIIRNNYPDLQGLELSEFFPRYFPLIYDVCYGKGFSFRIRISTEEKDLIKKVLMACILNLDSVECTPLALEDWPLERFDIEEVNEVLRPSTSSSNFNRFEVECTARCCS